MKKNILAAVSILSVLSLASCGEPTLSIFNWGAYLSKDVQSDFEKANSCNIKQQIFETNESMIQKLENTSYDIVVPSDYAVEELAAKGKIVPLDQTKFSAYSPDKLVPAFKSRLDELKASGFDLLKYAVPYTWGEVGIIYDSSVISEAEIKKDGWEAMRKTTNADGTKRKACVYNAARDIYSIALSACGYDFVSPTDDQIAKATDWLVGMKNAFDSDHLAFRGDEILDEMPAHYYDICLTYSGDAIWSIQTEQGGKHNLKFYIPDPVNGADVRTNIYTDCLCITSDCANVDLAYKFMDYVCQPEAAELNTADIGYETPIAEAYDAVTSEGGYYADVADTYRLTPISQDHFYRYNDALKSKLEELWAKNIVVGE
jgi:spermidine/putrescine-binding protein